MILRPLAGPVPAEALAPPIGWSRIGRSPRADIRLAHESVSRRHALLIRTPEDGLRVIDDRSLNGTFVNGKPILWSALAPGDELGIGDFRLAVAVGSGEVELPLAG